MEIGIPARRFAVAGGCLGFGIIWISDFGSDSAPLVHLRRRLAAEAEALAIEGPVSSFSVSAESVPDTQLLKLQATGTDPGLITAAANTLVEVFVEWQAVIQESRYRESKENLEAEMGQVQGNIQGLEVEIQALEAEGDAADSNELSRLQDQLAQYRNSYTALLNSYSNIGLAEANSGDTITVVSPAVRPKL